MKSDGLLTLITYSEKRKMILLNLMEEPKTLEYIKDYLNVTTPEILPRIRELESNFLVYKKDKKYALTPLAIVILNKFKPLVDTIKIIERNRTFWEEHSIEPIPGHLLDRIQDLGDYEIVDARSTDFFDGYPALVQYIMTSNTLKGLSSTFDLAFPSLFIELAHKKIDISLILTTNVYRVVEKYYKKDTTTFYKHDSVDLRQIDDDEADITFIVTDRFLSIFFNKNDGSIDLSKNLMSFDKSAIKWGNDLFCYYKEKSKECTIDI
jgi:predicted transcriptional regulator